MAVWIRWSVPAQYGSVSLEGTRSHEPRQDFELPVFDRPMVDLPSGMTHEQVVAEFDEIIKAFRSREPEDVPEFKM